MSKMYLLIILNLFFFIFPVFAEKEDILPLNKEHLEEILNTSPNYPKRLSFSEIIKYDTYPELDKEEEREILREEWKDLLYGLDIFYPYFKVKEFEDWIGEKINLQIFNIKGKPKLEGDEILYIFRLKL